MNIKNKMCKLFTVNLLTTKNFKGCYFVGKAFGIAFQGYNTNDTPKLIY